VVAALTSSALDTNRDPTPVFGVSHRARRDDPERAGACLPRPPCIFGHRRGRPIHRHLGETTTRAKAFAESGDALILHDGLPAASCSNVGDEQADRGGAEGDGGQSHLTTPCREATILPNRASNARSGRDDYFWRLRM